ncbi:MAG: nucleotidyl transferase AbiEii/AbiGii toxin family protein [Candidatus Accumulibacter sp.]|jgi:hypothetical protein|nr:nucleotidyl transferase AbiEii/AbiGii toxin family protein [Accumulibacter sp.]
MVQISQEALKALMNIGDNPDVQSLAAQVGDEDVSRGLDTLGGRPVQRAFLGILPWPCQRGSSSRLACAEVCVTRKFRPCMEISPPAPQCFWPELHNAPNLGFTLYGGTAIALRPGHRVSIDFDFFPEKPLDREAIKAAFPFVA